MFPMRLSLPLKILLWFFLNLAILVAVFLLLFSAEYQFNLDWLSPAPRASAWTPCATSSSMT